MTREQQGRENAHLKRTELPILSPWLSYTCLSVLSQHRRMPNGPKGRAAVCRSMERLHSDLYLYPQWHIILTEVVPQLL